eukprot:TRINITY_DN32391_c0_g1_i1.p1 TRINITY_DN32391_c0_g1~~TRINITY_DN32391_c0_g1_i1.p1  ORF type:complete len:316 (+),score=71.31 TRINITY_DN32391_c0_g1_i1:61-1008(+)
MLEVKDVSGDVAGRTITVDIGHVSDDCVFEKVCTRDVIVVIPGNPGVARFYLKFAAALKKEVKGDPRVVCMSYAGHGFAKRDGVFTVEEQVGFTHGLVGKIAEKNPAARLHLVGHSVGAYVAVQVAGKFQAEGCGTRIASINGLFPTVEHIAQGTNARVWPVLLPGMRQIASGIGGAVGWLPQGLRRRAAGLFASTNDEAHLAIVADMADYSLLHNILHMADSEFKAIKDICPVLLGPLASRCQFYYGVVDGWVQPYLVPRMRDTLAGLSDKPVGDTVHHDGPKVVVDATGAPHAFVLTHSDEVAAAIAPMLKCM